MAEQKAKKSKKKNISKIAQEKLQSEAASVSFKLPESEKSKFPIKLPSGLFRGKHATQGLVCGMCDHRLGAEGTEGALSAVGCDANKCCWSHKQCVLLVYPNMNIEKDSFTCNFHKIEKNKSILPSPKKDVDVYLKSVGQTAASSSTVSRAHVPEPLQEDEQERERSEWHRFYNDADKVNRAVEVESKRKVTFEEEEGEIDVDKFNGNEASPPACYSDDIAENECNRLIAEHKEQINNDDDQKKIAVKKIKINDEKSIPYTVLAEIYFGHKFNRRIKPHYYFTNFIAIYKMGTENGSPSPMSIDPLHTSFKLNWRNADVKNQNLKKDGLFHHSHPHSRSQNETQLKWDMVLSMALDNLYVFFAVLQVQKRETTPSDDSVQTYSKKKFCYELVMAINRFVTKLIDYGTMKVIKKKYFFQKN